MVPEDQAGARTSGTMTSAERGALASLSLAQFTTTLEFSVVFVALPSIARAFHLEPVAVPWVAGAYAVTFGGLLVLGGRLADRLGARRLFLAAVTGFAAASVVGTLAISTAVLLIARASQGVAAAMLQPAVLGLMQARFPREPVRGRAWARFGQPSAPAVLELGRYSVECSRRCPGG
jgi:MFS family permease